jgi:hypothetical protein
VLAPPAPVEPVFTFVLVSVEERPASEDAPVSAVPPEPAESFDPAVVGVFTIGSLLRLHADIPARKAIREMLSKILMRSS